MTEVWQQFESRSGTCERDFFCSSQDNCRPTFLYGSSVQKGSNGDECLNYGGGAYLNCPVYTGVVAMPFASNVIATIEAVTVFDVPVNWIEVAVRAVMA